MKIVHICLAARYIEGWGYQENLLPQMHKKMGLDVTVLTSDDVFNEKYVAEKRKELEYINPFGIHVKTLPRTTRYGWISRFNDFDNVYKTLEEEKPEIIFVHGGQFFALKDVIRYCKKHRDVKLYIDQHGDYYNMPVTDWKNKIAQKLIYGHWIRQAVPYCSRFWGVTPWRCQYLNDVYGVPKEKIELLVMGADDQKIHFDQMPQLRDTIRQSLNIDPDDFVVITGGKIDKTKNIHLLMQAVSEINADHLKLIVFGQPNDEMAELIENLSKDKHIRNIGWQPADKVYDYFLASDLVVFPGTHSVLWEQACGCGIPIMVKDWEGMHHVDVGGNCEFLTQDSVTEMKNKVFAVYENHEKYNEMKRVAVEKGIPTFSYKQIAKRAIDMSESE